jgi:hypothetical protein
LPKSSGNQYLLGTDKPTATVSGLIESAGNRSQNDSELKEQALRNIGALKAMLSTPDGEMA